MKIQNKVSVMGRYIQTSPEGEIFTKTPAIRLFGNLQEWRGKQRHISPPCRQKSRRSFLVHILKNCEFWARRDRFLG